MIFLIKISGLQVKSRFLEERVSVSLSGPAGGRLQPSCLCFFSFVLPPLFASFPSRVGHVAARLSWHGGGRTDYVCLQSLITSLRIDYYSCSLVSRGSGRGSHSNIKLHRAERPSECRCVTQSLFAAKWQAFVWRLSGPLPLLPYPSECLNGESWGWRCKVADVTNITGKVS